MVDNIEVSHPDVKYMRVGNKVITLRRDAQNFYEDMYGTIWALYDPQNTTDPISRCGVAPFALPTWPVFVKMNEGCGPHDFAYSSDVYQAFHDRSTADDYLQSLEQQEGYPIFGLLFKIIARELGGSFWENKETND